jgi:universal stress protein A
MKVEKILVPMDFSDHSRKALEHAIELATKFGASVDLLHSYRINYSGVMPYGADFPAALYEDIHSHASTELTKLHEIVEKAGVKCEMHLSQDEPSHAIAEAAKELSSDLIVMGTHGRTGLAHIALGSVAERTVRTAPCPVLTINEN